VVLIGVLVVQDLVEREQGPHVVLPHQPHPIRDVSAGGGRRVQFSGGEDDTDGVESADDLGGGNAGSLHGT
jgi:hypothetical protein